MSLLLSHLAKHGFVRRSSLLPLLLSNGFSSSSTLQTPPCSIIGNDRRGILIISNANESGMKEVDKLVPMWLVYNCLYGNKMVTIGASHGWVATLKVDEGILRLTDDLNPAASDTNRKRIPLPSLVTLPLCKPKSSPTCQCPLLLQRMRTVSWLSSFWDLSSAFADPVRATPSGATQESNPCFYSSRVTFSKKDDMFRIPGSGGHLIGSWDLCEHINKPKLQRLRFENLPKLTKTKRELLDSCCMTVHLVESITTGETFLAKLYKKTAKIIKGIAKMKTQEVMVFKLDDEGNAVYTKDIGDLSIFLSRSEPFCVQASSFPSMLSNYVNIFDSDEIAHVSLAGNHEIVSIIGTNNAPYYIPPQNVD